MKPREDGQKRLQVGGKITVRWGDKVLQAPTFGAVILIIILIVGMIFLYSDWTCGPLHHDADDVPKKAEDVKK